MSHGDSPHGMTTREYRVFTPFRIADASDNLREKPDR